MGVKTAFKWNFKELEFISVPDKLNSVEVVSYYKGYRAKFCSSIVLEGWIKKDADLWKDPVASRRELITNLYIKGKGIEIGALHNPLIVPESAKVKYVDRMTVFDLREHYSELSSLDLVIVDIICDGEKLEKIENDSQDFVIANHFFEHC